MTAGLILYAVVMYLFFFTDKIDTMSTNTLIILCMIIIVGITGNEYENK